MIYIFTYQLKERIYNHVCNNLKEAETFFDILVSANANYIRVITKKGK